MDSVREQIEQLEVLVLDDPMQPAWCGVELIAKADVLAVLPPEGETMGTCDHAMLAVALREWARLIRRAEDQAELFIIADELDVNASALEGETAASQPAETPWQQITAIVDSVWSLDSSVEPQRFTDAIIAIRRVLDQAPPSEKGAE